RRGVGSPGGAGGARWPGDDHCDERGADGCGYPQRARCGHTCDDRTLGTTVVAGSTFLLTATLRDSAGNVLDRALLWSCGCGEVAQLDPTGARAARVTALIAGEGTVYANQDGIPPVGSARITVKGTGNVA